MLLDTHLMLAKDELERARNLRDIIPTRGPLFMALALAIRNLFDENTSLQRLRITTRMAAEAPVEGSSRTLRHRLVVAIDAPDCPDLQTDEQKLQFILDHVPTWLMGDGELVVDENTTWFEPLGSPHHDVRRTAAYAAAMAIDEAFEVLHPSWDVELAQ
jgi:hypothetical protein